MPVNGTTNFSNALVNAWTEVMAKLFGVLPNLIFAVAIFAIGWIVAEWIKTLTIKLLDTIRLSNLLKGTGIRKFLRKAEVTEKVEEVIGSIIKWLIVLIAFIASMDILGLSTVALVLESILGYIPKVISAAIILTIGVLVAGFVESLVKGAVGSVNVKTGRLFGKISSYTVVIFASLAAISELGIAQAFINTIFTGFIAMLAIGFGLAIGLGAKDLIARILNDWYESFHRDTN